MEKKETVVATQPPVVDKKEAASVKHVEKKKEA